jgi:Carboxypeptidase regulatory-like domain
VNTKAIRQFTPRIFFLIVVVFCQFILSISEVKANTDEFIDSNELAPNSISLASNPKLRLQNSIAASKALPGTDFSVPVTTPSEVKTAKVADPHSPATGSEPHPTPSPKAAEEEPEQQEKSVDSSPLVLAATEIYFPRKIAIGISVNGKAQLDNNSIYVWGEERRSNPINLSDWLIPVNEINKITGWSTKIVAGQLEVVAGNLKTIRLPIQTAPTAAGFSQAIAIQDLANVPGVEIKFNARTYSIDFTIPIYKPIERTLSAPDPKNSTRANSALRYFTSQKPEKCACEDPYRMLVGLYVNGVQKIEAFFVIGKEDGTAAVDFDNWILPFDEISPAIGWKIKEVDDYLDISTPSQRFRIATNKVFVHPELGRAIKVADLAAIPGWTINFNINKYAIEITTPNTIKRTSTAEPPIIMTGLEPVGPPSGVSIIQQRINTSGTSAINIPQGDFQAAGNIGDSSWYLRANQPNITDTRTWNLSEASVIHQTKLNDIILGSQTPFWQQRSSRTGSYWAATSVTRQGFEPPVKVYGGAYTLNERLQARQTSRVVSGIAEPGTLVQLVNNNNRTQVLQETLVDSSGIYRFNNVLVSGNLDDSAIGRDYQVLLYPRGQITANPISQNVSFTSFNGQIPLGAEAFVISAGGNRITSGNFGSFDGAQGGVLYRRGLTESLTIGAGVAYDREVRGVGEFFWQPSAALELTGAATSGSDRWDYAGRLAYNPSRDFNLNANVDRLSTNANSYWRLGKNFAAIGNYDSSRGPAIGGEYFNSSADASTQVRADIDLKGRTRISANQRLGELQASYLGNESADNLQLTYSPRSNGSYGSNSGSDFVAGYQASKQANNSSLTSIVWRYRSPEILRDGRSLWQTELGYGFNNFGSGLLANADLNILPGLQLRASYRGINDNSRQGNYALELTTTLLTGNGIRGTADRVEDFRSLGKVIFQPFMDKNQNGRQDAGEAGYWDPLLVRLNDRPIDRYRPQVNDNRADLNLPNGSYRLDIDPAGYPDNSRSRLDALRIDVVAGGITTIPIPLIQSYSVVGFVKDAQGEAIAGGRVEATNMRTKIKAISVTNDSGFYTLEGLDQDEYQIKVSDLPSSLDSSAGARGDRLKIVPSSPAQQEINLIVQTSAVSK